MKKENRISVNTLESIFKASAPTERRLEFDLEGGEKISVDVKTVLSLPDMTAFVNEVVDECFDEDGEYYPEYRAYMIRRQVLAYYGGFTMPKDHKKAYQWIYGTPVYDRMMEVIDSTQFDELLFAITDKIQHHQEVLLSGERQALMKAAAKMDEVSESVRSLTEGVDMEAFMTAVSGLGDTFGNMPREQIVHELVEAVTRRRTEQEKEE